MLKGSSLTTIRTDKRRPFVVTATNIDAAMSEHHTCARAIAAAKKLGGDDVRVRHYFAKHSYRVIWP